MKPLLPVHLLAPLLVLAGPASAEPVVRAEAVEVTSGGEAVALLDGDRKTGWTPAGDPEDEGVLFRFSPPLAVDTVRVVSCPASPSVTLQGFANGRRAGTPVALEPGAMGHVTFPSRFKADAKETVRLDAFFLRIDDAAGTPCLAEVVFERAGGVLPVAAPRVVHAKASASSNVDANPATSAFDGRPQTAWLENAKGTGAGEWLDLRLSTAVTVTAIQVWNGRQGSKAAFAGSPRAGRLTVAAGDKTFSLTLQDRMEAQSLSFPEAVTSSSFRFTIARAVPGTKRKDLAIAEIALVGEEGPIAISFEEPAAPKTIALPIADRQRTSFCAKTDGTRRRLKLRASGTFAAWEEAESGAASSLLGTWTPSGGTSPWTTLELRGESRSTEPGSAKDATKSVTAKVEVARIADLGQDGFVAAVARLSNAATVDCIHREGIDSAYRLLVEGDAIVVRGAGLDDVLWRTRR